MKHHKAFRVEKCLFCLLTKMMISFFRFEVIMKSYLFEPLKFALPELDRPDQQTSSRGQQGNPCVLCVQTRIVDLTNSQKNVTNQKGAR